MSQNHPYGLSPLSSEEVRQSFMDFFLEREHTFVRSSSVAPTDDPTLLFTNAGMNQFKSIFLGDNSKGWKRATNSQKVLRVSGKHNDLEEVGLDGTHHTFFEMLGTWSFGDYYKKEAIDWAWELLTKVWKLPKNRLFATVYEDDHEALELWTQLTDIDPSHILKFGKKDNFWEMGQVGPCGPCSEIHFDTGDLGTQAETFSDSINGVNGENTRYVEIWNLVFTQNQRLMDGSLKDLQATHVDTGAGLERICAIMQGVSSNYETDLLKPIIEDIEKRTGVPYQPDEKGMPHRVIVDHLRAGSFAIADGVTPGNEGRGYVIRRIMRRAIRYAHQLGQKQPFIYQLLPALVEKMGQAFPELVERQDYIAQVIRSEEQRFLRTLETGLQKLEQLIENLKKQKNLVIPGHEGFLFHDTYGFPRDLTRLIASEQGLSFDEEGFDAAMAEQKDRARKASKFDSSAASDEAWVILDSQKHTEFLGYQTLECEKSQVLRYREVGDSIDIVFNKTPFYAEAGGQIGDQGSIKTKGLELRVEDTLKVFDMHIHRCTLVSGLVEKDQFADAKMSVDPSSRSKTRRNHSATHLLHDALREVLGSHVVQQGSYVGPDRLRFDFTHHQGVSAGELEKIELLVNQKIQANDPVETEVMTFDEAKESGAVALFGEKYGDTVRVLTMGSSRELCGGTHATATGEIGYFRIASESSIAAGVRRLEAVTGEAAVEASRTDAILVQSLSKNLKVKQDVLVERTQELVKNLKKIEKELSSLKEQQNLQELQKLRVDNRVELQDKSGHLSVIQLDPRKFEKQALAKMNQELAGQLTDEIVIMTRADSDDLMIFAAVGESVRKRLGAGQIMKELAVIADGRGGGRPDRAQAGSKSPEKAQEVCEKAIEIVQRSFQ